MVLSFPMHDPPARKGFSQSVDLLTVTVFTCLHHKAFDNSNSQTAIRTIPQGCIQCQPGAQPQIPRVQVEATESNHKLLHFHKALLHSEPEASHAEWIALRIDTRTSDEERNNKGLITLIMRNCFREPRAVTRCLVRCGAGGFASAAEANSLLQMR